MRYTIQITCSLLAMLMSGCLSTKTSTVEPVKPRVEPGKSVVRIQVTSQAYSFIQPWRKKKPASKAGMAVLIEGDKLIVPSSLVQDHTFIELERIADGTKSPGKLVTIDYGAGLALVEPADGKFLEGMVPLSLRKELKIGEKADAWQFDNGNPIVTTGELRRAEAGLSLLSYRFDITLPSYASAPLGMPIVHNGKLVAITKSYSSSNRTLYAYSAQVLDHFLTDVNDGSYQGFPGAGLGFSLLDDPQLRDYVALPKGEQGVYITYVRPGSPSAKAGLKKGDVLLGIDEFDIDRRAKYEDPDYGKLDFGHIISTKSFAGTKRQLHVWRDRARLSLPITLDFIPVDTYPVAPYIHDRGPDYLIVSGVIFMELSQQFLREWRNWRSSAPQRLVYYDRNQWEVIEPGSKLVIAITFVLRSPAILGYEEFNFKVLDKVNGKKITSLRDVKSALGGPVKRNGGSFHQFIFKNPPKVMVLDADQVARQNAAIKMIYRLPALERFHKK